MKRKWAGLSILTLATMVQFQNCSRFTANNRFQLQPGSAPISVFRIQSANTGAFEIPDCTPSTDRTGFILPAAGIVVSPSFGTDSTGKKYGIYFSAFGKELLAYNTQGKSIWALTFEGITGVMPSLDWNKDGIPDVFIAENNSASQTVNCVDFSGNVTGETHTVKVSSLYLYSGADGTQLFNFGQLPDICQTSNGTHYTAPQWTGTSVIASQAEQAFAISPYYATQSWFFKRNSSGTVITDTLLYPSTASFDTYSQAKLSASGQKYWANAHAFNGLFVNGFLDFFTSGRFASYSLTPLSASQLNFDLPYLPEDHEEGSGRNNGLVVKDPNSNLVSLIGGCSVQSVYEDLKNGSISVDPYCGITRHFDVIDTASGTLIGSKFYSYVHNGGSGASNYQERVVYPSNPVLKSSSGPSIMIYNVYSGGRWYMHFSSPGQAASQSAIKDYIVWDVLDIDADGVDEVLFSRTKDPAAAEAPGYYFPLRKTFVGHMNGATLSAVAELDGVPVLAPSSKRDNVSSNDAVLFAAQRVLGKQNSLFMLDSNNKPVEVEYTAGTAQTIASASVKGSDQPVATFHWVTVTDQAIACQYGDQGPVGTQVSGRCYSEGQLNIYEWGTGIPGGCASPTFLRNRVTQKCVRD